MQAFDYIRAPVRRLQQRTGCKIELQFPVRHRQYLYDSLAGSHVESVDILPTRHLRFRNSPGRREDLLHGHRRHVERRFALGGLYPRELLFELQQQAGAQHHEKRQRDGNRAPAMQLPIPDTWVQPGVLRRSEIVG